MARRVPEPPSHDASFDRACKPSTIENRRACLRLAASAAVRRGAAPEELRSLADLVSPHTVRLILDDYLAKKNGEVVNFTIDLAERLYAIARQYVKAPPAEIQPLEEFCVKLRKKRRKGMTRKNVDVVRYFKDARNRERLKALPGHLFDEALAEQDAPIQAAVKAEIAREHPGLCRLPQATARHGNPQQRALCRPTGLEPAAFHQGSKYRKASGATQRRKQMDHRGGATPTDC